jgi:hypothetical protein
MTIDWAIVSPVVVGLIAAATGFLTAKVQHKGKPENALIDQMQENQHAADERLARLETRIKGFEARDQVYIPHIIRLNMHIEQGLGPPAPKIPKVILDYLRDKEDEDEL